MFKIWNKYIHPLSSADYELIKKAILSRKYETTVETTERTISDRLGPAFGTIDLLFEPVDEMGVVFLFAKHHREIGFPFIVKLRSRFPDAIAIDMKGEKKLIELEFRSSGFNHDPKGCDYIVCWVDDLDEELKEKMPQLMKEGLRGCQVEAIKNLERSFSLSRPRALIQMASGAGKTFAAVTFAYRLVKFPGANASYS